MRSDWTVTPIAPAGGAIIGGVDLGVDRSPPTLDALHDLLTEHLVLVLRDQTLDAAAHVEVGSRFGEPYVHPFLEAVPEHPAILQVLKTEEDEATFGGEFWHADITFESPPSSVSLLHSFEIPPLGGDTLFANQFLAYDTLSSGLRRMLDGLEAVHAYPDLDVEIGRTAAVHPVVRTHPVSGRRALFVNPAFVSRFVDMTEAESTPILRMLFEHQTREEFRFRVRWQPRQLTIWDNRAVQHYALNDYAGHRRRLQRVTVMEIPDGVRGSASADGGTRTPTPFGART